MVGRYGRVIKSSLVDNGSPLPHREAYINVLACLEISPEDVVRAKKFMSEHIRYEALQQQDSTRCQGHRIQTRILNKKLRRNWQELD